jgi:hypothetical protein
MSQQYRWIHKANAFAKSDRSLCRSLARHLMLACEIKGIDYTSGARPHPVALDLICLQWLQVLGLDELNPEVISKRHAEITAASAANIAGNREILSWEFAQEFESAIV